MLRYFFSAIFFFCIIFNPSSVRATPADALEGWYEILSESQVSGEPQELVRKYFLLEADTLEKIWAKYADGPLPENLVQYKNEPSILAAFTHRDTLFLTFESSALIGDGYIRIAGSNNTLLEMRRRGDGSSDLAVQENQRVSRYLLARPDPLTAPIFNRKNSNKSIAIQGAFER